MKMVSLATKSRMWTMFYCLYKAGPNGLRRKLLTDRVWHDDTGIDNLDKQKSNLNKILEKIGLEVVAARGKWILTELK